MAWFVIAWMVAMAAYGLLNILVPAITIGWQNSVTATRSKRGREDIVGVAFQRLLGQTTADGRNEPLVRKRVRLIGLCEFAIAAVVVIIVAVIS